MAVLVTLVLISVLVYFVNLYMDLRERALISEKALERANDEYVGKNFNLENNSMEEKKGTRDLFLETLTRIGCQYEFGEGDDISFGYQGEHFIVRANNNNHFIHIYDTYWGHVELYNVEDLSRLKKAINESNLNNCVTAVYTVDEAGGTVDVHSKTDILFTQEIPAIDDYLRMELNEFFRVHETINIEMAKQREKEMER